MSDNFVDQPERTYALARYPKQLRGTIGGAPTPATPIGYAKLAQIVENELRCFEFHLPTGTPGGVLAGNDLTTQEGSTVVFLPPGSTDFCGPPAAQIGDTLEIQEGPDAGSYQIVAFGGADPCRILGLDQDMTKTNINLDWRIQIPAGPPDPDAPLVPNYSQVIKARAVPGSPLHRYRPYMGPGDHTGSDLVTAAGSSTVTAAGATFLDPLNPVVPGMYIEIAAGSDAGRHEIANVVNGTTLELVTPMTADATGLSYRIDIVSDHATTLQLVPVSGGKLIAVPDQDSIEVKIARPIRDEIDAAAFDTARELGTTEAVDLFDIHGAYLACYRLQDGASHSQGVPIDNRVIIAAMPWRGHAVDGVLFFDDQDPAQEKYDLSDADEPVWPIRWLRDHWRLEMAIGREPLQEPTEDEACPDE